MKAAGALGRSQQEMASEPTGQTPHPLRTSVRGEGGEGSRTGFLRDPAQQREVSSCLEGDQSPWKYRVWVAGNGGTHYGLVGGETPWSRSALGRDRAGLGLQFDVGALAAGLKGRERAHPRECIRPDDQDRPREAPCTGKPEQGRPAQSGQGELRRGIPVAKRPKPEAPPRWCEDLPSSAPSGLRDRDREIGGGNAATRRWP